MKPIQLLVLACVAAAAVGYFVFEVMLFRLSCSLAKLPRPSVPRSIGIVCAVAFVAAIAEGVLGVAVTEAYLAGGYPLWEAGVVVTFLGLPLHMALCAAIHAKLMDIRFADGIAVWKVEKSIKFGLLVVAGAIVGLVVLIVRA